MVRGPAAVLRSERSGASKEGRAPHHDVRDRKGIGAAGDRSRRGRGVRRRDRRPPRGRSLTAVGALFQRDRTTVAHACGVVEDRRDDPDLDARIEHLEHAVGVPDRCPWLGLPAMKGSSLALRGSAGERNREIRSLLLRLAGGAALTRDCERGFRLTERPRPVLPPLPERRFRPSSSSKPASRKIGSNGTAICCCSPMLGALWLRRSLAEGDAFRAQHQVKRERRARDRRHAPPGAAERSRKPSRLAQEPQGPERKPLAHRAAIRGRGAFARRLLVCADEPARDGAAGRLSLPLSARAAERRQARPISATR